MAPVKRRTTARSRNTMKSRRGRPNIPELVYKFLRGVKGVGHSSEDTCQTCGLLKPPQELSASAAPRKSQRRTMPKRRGKDGTRGVGKSRVEKRRRPGSDHLSTVIQKARASEDLREIKNFIQKALDFGLKSGYLVANDDSQRVLRVSSELITDGVCYDKDASDEKAISHKRERTPERTPSKSVNYRESEANRRHKKRKRSRRRSRSGSKKRRRRSRKHRKHSRSQVPEKPAENVDDCDIENPEDGQRTDDADPNVDDPHLHTSDAEKNVRNDDDEESESSTGEEESDDDDDDKKDDGTAKS